MMNFRPQTPQGIKPRIPPKPPQIPSPKPMGNYNWINQAPAVEGYQRHIQGQAPGNVYPPKPTTLPPNIPPTKGMGMNPQMGFPGMGFPGMGQGMPPQMTPGMNQPMGGIDIQAFLRMLQGGMF